jgi:hypothetical protein
VAQGNLSKNCFMPDEFSFLYLIISSHSFWAQTPIGKKPHSLVDILERIFDEDTRIERKFSQIFFGEREN